MCRVIGLPSKLLKVNDAAWLLAESRRTPMHVGMLATFSLPEGADDSYLGDLVDTWRGVRTFSAPFNYVLRGPTLLPSWKELPDDEIDVDYHLRHSAVPAPGGERALGVLVSRLHSQRLDRRYPLWECHVIEGVQDGKWSLYVKVHHSQIDGVGGIRFARRMFSVDPDARDMQPPWAIGLSGPDQSGVDRPAKARIAKVADGAGTGARSAVSVVTSLTRSYAESITGLGGADHAVPFRAPRSVLNTRIHAPRRFATQHYEMARMKAVAAAAEGSLNDVFLAICGGALRRYLTELDALPEQTLTANVPVSVRPEGAVSVGNAITFLYTELGTDIADPVARVQAIRASTQVAKARIPDAAGPLMEAYTSALMGPFLAPAVLGVGGYGPPDANLVLSNVPGLRETRYFNGSRLEAYFPLSLLFHGQGLNITGVSNADTFCIGYTGCRDTLPHLQRVAVYSGKALEELESALGLAGEPTQPES